MAKKNQSMYGWAVSIEKSTKNGFPVLNTCLGGILAIYKTKELAERAIEYDREIRALTKQYVSDRRPKIKRLKISF